MNDTIIAELITQGGLGTVLVLVLLWIGRGMVDEQKAHTAEVKAQGEAAAARDAASDIRAADRHTAVVTALGDVREAIARSRHLDEHDDFDDTTPVRSLRPARNGKRP